MPPKGAKNVPPRRTAKNKKKTIRGSKSTARTKVSNRNSAKKCDNFDFQQYINEAFPNADSSSTGIAVNGWKIKTNSRGVYWHSKINEDFKLKFPRGKYEEKGNKPFSLKPDKTLCDDMISAITKNKTKRLISREARDKAKKEKVAARRLPKMPFCRGCEFSPQGITSKKCDNMRFYQDEGIFSCKSPDWWNWNWCYNAERIYSSKRKVFLGKFNCKKTGTLCPFNKETIVKNEFILGRDFDGNHFTTCKMYDGHRTEPKLPEPKIQSSKKQKRKSA
jgi:hypothetical protein